MKLHAILILIATVCLAEWPPKPKGPPPGGESAEMKALLASFKLTAEQQAKYDAAKKKTGEEMRAIHEGKVSGKLAQDEVLKQALASHKAFNAAVKTILSAKQFAQWEPLREADHHKIAQAHKERDSATSGAGSTKPRS